MVFASLSFLMFFLPLTLAAYFICSNRTWRNVLLLAVSLFFYAWGEPIYVILMLLSIVFNWAVGLALVRWQRGRKWTLAAGVAINLLGIAVFKYAGFLVLVVNYLLGLNLHVPSIALPIGISFYTFQAVSYLVDVYRGVVQPQANPIFYGMYHTLFSQLVAGPIVRYATVAKEVANRRENLHDFSAGVRRFLLGLAKKVLIANTMGRLTDTVLAAGPQVGALPAWYAFVGYAFQIYFDFSGYSDMAIGLGWMFGFHFLENFNYPYIARSVTDFWRRWHMSLSSFFRDYVYIPLGGNRVARPRLVLNLIIVWSLTGLWHGASWNFVIWGLYFGLLLIGEKLMWGAWLERRPRVLQHLYTIVILLIGWVIFRVEDFRRMGGWLAAMFGMYGWGHPAMLDALNVLHYWPWFLIAGAGATPVVGTLLRRLDEAPRAGWLADTCLMFLMVWAFLGLVISGFNPFIYFRF